MIEIRDALFGYRRNKKLFQNLQLNLEKGQVYGLLGKNGAGKSTLLKIIGGLVFPTKGLVQVMNYNPAKRQPSFLEKVFFIPEEIDTPNIPAKDFAASFKFFYPNFSMVDFEKSIAEFDVPNTSLAEMSYGQKKKTWIAIGLAANTDLLLLDEPTNGLDIPSKKKFRKLMAGAINENRCVIISTHQVKDLDGLIDNVVIIDEGQVLLNTALETVSNKLVFYKLEDGKNESQPIYEENTLLGTIAVSVNTSQQITKPDLELLFNAAIANKKLIQQLFTQA